MTLLDMRRSASIPHPSKLGVSCSSGSLFAVKYMDYPTLGASHIALFSLESQQLVQDVLIHSTPKPWEDLCLQAWSRDESFAIFWNVRYVELCVARLSRTGKAVRVVSPFSHALQLP